MFRQVFTIAGNTFIEAVRQPVFFVLVTAGWILQILNVALSGYTMGLTDEAEVTKDDKMLLDMGLATVFVLVTLLAAFICTSVVGREIENKTALTVISKPIGRPLFVIGKYLGATGAVLLAGLILSMFFLLAIRQGVMTTVRDPVDLPVVLFGLAAILVSVGVGAWCNFFYGWVFSSTSVFTLAPAIVLAWIAVLLVNKEWLIQSPAIDFKPQVVMTTGAVLLAMPVLSGVALAASTRLGQVMTIVVCAGVFVLGLLSNHLIGRYAVQNDPVGLIETVEHVDDRDGDLADAGDAWALDLEFSPEVSISPGSNIYYGPAPNGLGLLATGQSAFEGDPENPIDLDDGPPALVLRAVEGQREDRLILVNAGDFRAARPPVAGDYVFLRPTDTNPLALAVWSIVPNMQFFWLVDAVTQAHDIPASYMIIAAGYSLAHVIALNALAVILFQRREVG